MPGVSDNSIGVGASGTVWSRPGYVALLEQVRGADMRVVERLLRRIDLTGDDAGLFEFGERLLAAPLGAPRRHARRDDLAVIAARLVVGEARVGEPVLLADHAAPAPEHRLADHRRDDPAVLGAVIIGGGRVEAAIDGRDPVRPRVSACSISSELAKATAVRSSAPSTFWPLPVLPRS